MEVQTLLTLNKDMQEKTEELEKRISEAHEKYVASKKRTSGKFSAGGSGSKGALRKQRRSISGRFEES